MLGNGRFALVGLAVKRCKGLGCGVEGRGNMRGCLVLLMIVVGGFAGSGRVRGHGRGFLVELARGEGLIGGGGKGIGVGGRGQRGVFVVVVIVFRSCRCGNGPGAFPAAANFAPLLFFFPAAKLVDQGVNFADEEVAFGLKGFPLTIGNTVDAHDAEPVVTFETVEEALELDFFVLGTFFFDVAELFFLTLGTTVGFEIERSGEGVGFYGGSIGGGEGEVQFLKGCKV